MILRTHGGLRAFSASALKQSQNHYEVLGLSVNATPDQIKRRFFALSKKYHPDRNPNHADPERYQQITAAYTVLSNAKERRKFDESLGTAVRRPQGYRSGRTWGAGSHTTTRRRPGASGYSYNLNNVNNMKQHAARYSSKLDPLRPDRKSSEAAPHFDFEKHAKSQSRYDEYRKATREQARKGKAASAAFRETAASASMGDAGQKSDPYASGHSFFAKGAAAAAAGITFIYLLLR